MERPFRARSSAAAVARTGASAPLAYPGTESSRRRRRARVRRPFDRVGTRSRTRPSARRAASPAGSRPISRSSVSTCIVESHPRFQAAPPHRLSGAWRASSRAPAPSVATLARSAATRPRAHRSGRASPASGSKGRTRTATAWPRSLASGVAAWVDRWPSVGSFLALVKRRRWRPYDASHIVLAQTSATLSGGS